MNRATLPDASPLTDDLDVTLHEPVTKENDMNEARASERADLVELRRLMEAATKGPWGFKDHGVAELVVYDAGEFAVCSFAEDGYAWRDYYSIGTGSAAEKNAAFIVAACNALPGLIAEVEQLRAELSRASATAQEPAESIWNAAVEACAKACAAEKLQDPQDDSDYGYDTACIDCEKAVRRLQRKDAPQPAATASRTVSDADELARDLAAEIVQSLSDSEPTGRSMEGMDKLRGTPLESMFVLDGDDIRSVAERVISNAIFDKRLSPAPSVAEVKP